MEVLPHAQVIIVQNTWFVFLNEAGAVTANKEQGNAVFTVQEAFYQLYSANKMEHLQL